MRAYTYIKKEEHFFFKFRFRTFEINKKKTNKKNLVQEEILFVKKKKARRRFKRQKKKITFSFKLIGTCDL